MTEEYIKINTFLVDGYRLNNEEYNELINYVTKYKAYYEAFIDFSTDKSIYELVRFNEDELESFSKTPEINIEKNEHNVGINYKNRILKKGQKIDKTNIISYNYRVFAKLEDIDGYICILRHKKNTKQVTTSVSLGLYSYNYVLRIIYLIMLYFAYLLLYYPIYFMYGLIFICFCLYYKVRIIKYYISFHNKDMYYDENKAT